MFDKGAAAMPPTFPALKAHLALNVKNVPRSVQFYRRMFAVEPCKSLEGYAKFDLANPPLNFTLNQVPFNERGALSHLGIEVASTADVLAMRARWTQQGLAVRDEMKTDCCYALQNKTWVADPDGNEWEVFVVLQDHLPETQPQPNPQPSAQQEGCCAPTCCLPSSQKQNQKQNQNQNQNQYEDDTPHAAAL
jgi:catechol 2,3-dioxygenase-like lactoylglutathione lyase family enzyme